MSDLTKINGTHLSRLAYVYLRQSSAAQVAHNRESTARQYALVAKAADLGWPAQQVLVIDEDLGVSGSGIVERWLCPAHRGGRAGPCRYCARPGGLAPGPQQRRLVSLARSLRPDRHPDRRR